MYLRIGTKTSACDFGVNVDQLVTYSVSAKAPIVKVLDVFPLLNRCHHITCGHGSESVAFVQQLCDEFNDCQAENRPCFGIWVHRVQACPPTPFVQFE